jgi:hypothetical protein
MKSKERRLVRRLFVVSVLLLLSEGTAHAQSLAKRVVCNIGDELTTYTTTLQNQMRSSGVKLVVSGTIQKVVPKNAAVASSRPPASVRKAFDPSLVCKTDLYKGNSIGKCTNKLTNYKVVMPICLDQSVAGVSSGSANCGSMMKDSLAAAGDADVVMPICLNQCVAGSCTGGVKCGGGATPTQNTPPAKKPAPAKKISKKDLSEEDIKPTGGKKGAVSKKVDQPVTNADLGATDATTDTGTADTGVNNGTDAGGATPGLGALPGGGGVIPGLDGLTGGGGAIPGLGGQTGGGAAFPGLDGMTGGGGGAFPGLDGLTGGGAAFPSFGGGALGNLGGLQGLADIIQKMSQGSGMNLTGGLGGLAQGGTSATGTSCQVSCVNGDCQKNCEQAGAIKKTVIYYAASPKPITFGDLVTDAVVNPEVKGVECYVTYRLQLRSDKKNLDKRSGLVTVRGQLQEAGAKRNL